MPRPKNNPNFDPGKLEAEVLKAVVELYLSPDNPNHDISYVAEELGISALKARKLLITADARNGTRHYESPLAEQIRRLKSEGKTVKEIGAIVKLSHGSVIGYLPYSKTVYSMRELSADAIRVQRCRERRKLCEEFRMNTIGLGKEAEERYLWETLGKLSGCIFHSGERQGSSGRKFSYTIPRKEDKNGAESLSGEMRVSRSDETLTRAAVMTAYWKAKGETVTGAKALDGVVGGSWLFPIFLRLGVCGAE